MIPHDLGTALRDKAGLCSHSMLDKALSERSKVQGMFASIASRYDLTNFVMSAGIHFVWRKALFDELDLRGGTQRQAALDLCTGTGALMPGLLRRFQICIGLDFCWPMLEIGQERGASRRGQSHSGTGLLVQGDALNIPLADGSVDLITVAYGVRNFEKLGSGLKEMHRVLKPGGTAVILEFGKPANPVIRRLYGLYARLGMPIIGGLLTGNPSAYSYLPETALSFPFGQEFCQELRGVGFINPVYRALTFGIAYLYTCEKPARTR